MIKCVAFDFDGVLVDSNAVKRSAYFDIFAPLGATQPVVRTVLEDNWDCDRYRTIGRILKRLVDAGLLGADQRFGELIGKYADRYNDICEEYAATCPEIAGVSTCLPRLAKRCGLYVNSATPEQPLCRIVRRRGWEGYFRRVMGGPNTKKQNLEWILQREQVSGQELLVVGDGRSDLIAARDLRCHFVGVRNDSNDFDRNGLTMMDDLQNLERLMAETLE